MTADGELRHIDAESEPELFWALRGGKGNFGVVTVLEFALIYQQPNSAMFMASSSRTLVERAVQDQLVPTGAVRCRGYASR